MEDVMTVEMPDETPVVDAPVTGEPEPDLE
jgi:hypothetical protein